MSRPTINVSSPGGGWPRPWPAVAELAEVLPSDGWTLIGGLMTQLHTINHGIDIVRPTNDVDIVLHIETSRGRPDASAAALISLGYELRPSLDPRINHAHRFVRGEDAIDLVTSRSQEEADVIDVLIADHPGPATIQQLVGRDMVRIEGGTQALQRTINARLEIVPGTITTISVPRPFGAVVLKAAAYRADSRARDRHLADAAALLACIENPFAERADLRGSDRQRLAILQRELVDDHIVWLGLPEMARLDARAALRVLCSPG